MNNTREYLTTAWTYLTDPRATYLALAASLVVLLLMARKVARHARPDEPLANVAMLLGLGWSAEAVWELTGPAGADFPTGLRIALFAVGEVILLISMVRTKRGVRENSRPGRAGRTVWIVAGAMALVGTLAADTFGEGVLRALIPLGLTLTWWQGTVPESLKRSDGPSSWRWTPRRIGLALKLIEPGEQDIETVHRERLTQQLTNLEFKRRAASAKRHEKLAAKLSRLSLLADDTVIDEVRRRVERSNWWTVTPLTMRPIRFAPESAGEAAAADPAPSQSGNGAANPAAKTAASGPAKTPANGAAKPPAKPAAKPTANGRKLAHPMADDLNPSIRALARTFAKHPAKTNAELAKLAGVSEGTANRYLGQIRAAAKASAPIQEPKQPVTAGVNGHHPNIT